MALSEAYSRSSTISTTLFSLTNDSTTIATKTEAGIYSLFVDTSTMAAGDQYEFFLYEKVRSGGTQYTISLGVLTGAQPGPFITAAYHLMHGWDFVAKRLAGTDRTIASSIRKVA